MRTSPSEQGSWLRLYSPLTRAVVLSPRTQPWSLFDSRTSLHLTVSVVASVEVHTPEKIARATAEVSSVTVPEAAEDSLPKKHRSVQTEDAGFPETVVRQERSEDVPSLSAHAKYFAVTLPISTGPMRQAFSFHQPPARQVFVTSTGSASMVTSLQVSLSSGVTVGLLTISSRPASTSSPMTGRSGKPLSST